MLYILVVDDEPDIREIIEMGLTAAYPLDIVLAESGNHALEVIKERGNPEIIISDYRMPNGDGLYLYQSLKAQKIDIPFIICSANPLEEIKNIFPDIHGHVTKPKILKSILGYVDLVVARHSSSPNYVPIRISLLLRLGMIEFDLFMRLSEKKYIKIINSGESFLDSDTDRFSRKKLSHLYIALGDAEIYLKSFEQNLSLIQEAEDLSEVDQVSLSFDTLETVERLASVLGWTPDIIDVAKKSVKLAIKTIATEPQLLKLLKQNLSNHTSKYSDHVTMLSMLSCLFSHQLGWTSDSTQMKLAMAALIHDVTIDEEFYENIEMWNLKAQNPAEKSEEVLKYRNHPIEAAKLILEMKNLPPDVDQIIIQHHELKDGTGFPRGLSYSRISPLTTLFIITQDFVNFFNDDRAVEDSVRDFLTSREEMYNSGSFKKVFLAIKEKLSLLGS
jgi:response regulator RpfG family c-di-GMP phosphodiesterase